jgi:hypothetical protein
MKRNQPPRTLQSTRFGRLSLHEICFGNFYSFYYTATYRHPTHGTVEVVFHPPDSDPSCWRDPLTSAEQRAEDLLASQRAILLTGKNHFEELFSSYGVEDTDIDALFPTLKLSLLKLNSTGNDEFVYAPSDLLPCCDLFVAVDRDLRVAKTHFDG